MLNTKLNLTENDFIATYGDVKVKFSEYFKYCFTFVGNHNGKTISVNVGSPYSDIYGLHIDATKEYPIKDLAITYAAVKSGSKILEEFIFS